MRKGTGAFYIVDSDSDSGWGFVAHLVVEGEDCEVGAWSLWFVWRIGSPRGSGLWVGREGHGDLMTGVGVGGAVAREIRGESLRICLGTGILSSARYLKRC